MLEAAETMEERPTISLVELLALVGPLLPRQIRIGNPKSCHSCPEGSRELGERVEEAIIHNLV